MRTHVENGASSMSCDFRDDRFTNRGRRGATLAAEHDEVRSHHTCVLDNLGRRIPMRECRTDASPLGQCTRQRKKRRDKTFRIGLRAPVTDDVEEAQLCIVQSREH